MKSRRDWFELANGYSRRTGMKVWLARLLMRLSFRLQRRARALSAPTWLGAGRAQVHPIPIEAMRAIAAATLAAAAANAAQPNRVMCGVRRADGAPCTLDRDHPVEHPHCYCGEPFDT